MIILWSSSDMGKAGDSDRDEDWMAEIIEEVEHKREGMRSYVKTAVDGKKDGTEEGVYNHYVPYSRIAAQMIEKTKNKSREGILIFLKQLQDLFKIGHPNIEPTESPYHFNQYYSAMFAFVCDWPENIFRGESLGDAQGRRIDKPIKHSQILDERLRGALDVLKSEPLEVNVNDTEGGWDSYDASKGWDWDPYGMEEES
ncbi:uncharacterized protein BDZ99DRAFT_462160 [Mytilinidion resinicola]|uniref:Uncharacterized protein n=1 Tax=Mytilinidion resinicola TaxID=574789 RepID=A0A6A6YQR9_9PEZI|nr:uncharacterized protein BDZ99DRAFT_462160 [Mytilinidion resinicola]KAF2810859.1 hypothetical protein BDZ99DRAFT_462160 [Mytilinidion resinicola]